MSSLLRDLFGVERPVIAMAHFGPLPGTPLYDAGRGVDGLADALGSDVRALLEGGVDAVLFCNEGDRPYPLEAPAAALATMARVIAELRPADRPFGVDYLWDAMGALSLAAATGAAFMREVVVGVYESDMGLWAPDAAELLRYRRQLGAEHVRVFHNVTPEFASPLGSRSPPERARSALTSSLVDAILVAGPRAGAPPEKATIAAIQAEIRGEVPVLLNTGARAENVADFLEIADGVIVGSGLKVDGYTWNPVDPARVRAFMSVVRQVRADRPRAAPAPA